MSRDNEVGKVVSAIISLVNNQRNSGKLFPDILIFVSQQEYFYFNVFQVSVFNYTS